MNTQDRINDLISNTYKNTHVGPEKIYRILKSKGITNVGRSRIKRLLRSQDSYTLRKELRHSFRRARVIVSGIDDQWDMDLADMSNIASENDQFRYLLVVVDIFSKYLWIQVLKNKSAKVVVEAMKKILAGNRKCKKIRTDKGKEFNNNIMKSYLKNEGIQYFTTQNSETKANYAERVIKTVKNMMYRYFTERRNHRYLDVLQDIVKVYNSTPHRSLNNIQPKDVSKTNEADIWAYMYLKPKKITSKKPRSYHFKANDFVRISYISMLFDRSYDEHFTREIFKVSRRFRMQAIPVYRIKEYDGTSIKGLFYESEMVKVNKDEDVMWYVEKKIRKRKRNGRVQWLVKFEGWPNKYNQWLNEEDITDPNDS